MVIIFIFNPIFDTNNPSISYYWLWMHLGDTFANLENSPSVIIRIWRLHRTLPTNFYKYSDDITGALNLSKIKNRTFGFIDELLTSVLGSVYGITAFYPSIWPFGFLPFSFLPFNMTLQFFTLQNDPSVFTLQAFGFWVQFMRLSEVNLRSK